MPAVSCFRFLCASAFSALLGLASPAGQAAAMTFSVQSLDGRPVILAKGPIETGDAARLRIALQKAGRDSFGHKTVLLDSPGGLVTEAFAMVTVMDQERVATVVHSGASCASACAQILFLSGIHRVVVDGGRLGLHSCHDPKDRARSTICNQVIARNAMARGTPYGSILAFIHLTSPAGMRWLDATEADCWGFTLWPPGSTRGIQKGDAAPCLLRRNAAASGIAIAAADRDGNAADHQSGDISSQAEQRDSRPGRLYGVLPPIRSRSSGVLAMSSSPYRAAWRSV